MPVAAFGLSTLSKNAPNECAPRALFYLSLMGLRVWGETAGIYCSSSFSVEMGSGRITALGTLAAPPEPELKSGARFRILLTRATTEAEPSCEYAFEVYKSQQKSTESVIILGIDFACTLSRWKEGNKLWNYHPSQKLCCKKSTSTL